jgi:hypothetical protein
MLSLSDGGLEKVDDMEMVFRMVVTIITMTTQWAC